MSDNDLSAWTHSHAFHGANEAAERGTRRVMWITLVTMVIEIAAGWWYNSMALLADGWHMSSHAVAIGVSAFAYAASRRLAGDPRFAFGTWKIEVLGGFASALFLLGVAALMVVGSLERMLSPQPIHYLEAIAVAVLGLAVNMLCATILGHAHDHHAHEHGHGHDHGHEHHHDLNLKSAYLHVLADAATSVLAILALLGGAFWGWAWLDPAMGIVGAALVAVWARNLIVETGKVLLDCEMDAPVVAEIREAIDAGAAAGSVMRITDLHVWRVGRGAYACSMSILTDDPELTPADIRGWLSIHEEVVHTTVEIQRRR